MLFRSRGHRGGLWRCTAAYRLDGICTSGCGSRPDVWRCGKGAKAILGKARAHRGRTVWRSSIENRNAFPKVGLVDSETAAEEMPSIFATNRTARVTGHPPASGLNCQRLWHPKLIRLSWSPAGSNAWKDLRENSDLAIRLSELQSRLLISRIPRDIKGS